MKRCTEISSLTFGIPGLGHANPIKNKKTKKRLDVFFFILGTSRSPNLLNPKVQLVAPAQKYMKTLRRWFTRNRVLSHLRITTAVTLMSAAAAMAFVAGGDRLFTVSSPSSPFSED